MKGSVPVGTSVFGHGVALALVLLTLAYSWHLCLMLLLAWCVVTLGVAANLGQTDMTKLCNAHWLLVASQLFALGSLITVNAWRTEVTLSPELELLQAAAATQHVMQHVSAGLLLFSSNEELMIANLSSLEAPLKVSPGLMSAHSFGEFEGRIVFAARQGQKQQLWYVDSTECCTSEAVMLHDFGSDMEVETIVVQNSTLLIRAVSSSCSSGRQSLFASDWVNTWEESSCTPQPRQDALFGELFLAALPTTLLSCWCIWKPALFASLFVGLYSMVVVIRLLINSDLVDAHDFICTSLTVYSSLAYLVGICWHLLRPSLSGKLMQLKDWYFAVTALSFSAALQLRLDVPESPASWRWVIFGLAAVLQMGIGQLVHQRWPKVMGLGCLQLCLGRVVLEPQLDVGSAAKQAFQLSFVGLACGSLWALLGDWSLHSEEQAEKIHPEAVSEQTGEPKDRKADGQEHQAARVAASAKESEVQPNAKVIPDYQREAYTKTQHIQQKLQSQESSAADVMAMDVESDVNSEEEV